MDDWYYATADRRRLGPLPASELRALAASGAIDARTLVWREGAPGWRPLHEFAAELELPALPPPLPYTAAAAPSGLPRSMVILLVAGTVGAVAIAVVGILAAIALPAYHDYTLRAQASAAIVEAQGRQRAVSDFLAAHGRCPRNGDAGFEPATHYASTRLSSIEFQQFESSSLCGLVATVRAPGSEQIDGSPIWLEYNPAVDVWMCSSSMDPRYLPRSCRD